MTNSLFVATGLSLGVLAVGEELGFDPWVQLGVAGVALLLVFWLIHKTIPSLMDSHKETVKDICASHEKNVETLRASHQSMNDKLCNHLDDVKDHLDGVKGSIDAGREEQMALLRTLITGTK